MSDSVAQNMQTSKKAEDINRCLHSTAIQKLSDVSLDTREIRAVNFSPEL